MRSSSNIIFISLLPIALAIPAPTAAPDAQPAANPQLPYAMTLPWPETSGSPAYSTAYVAFLSYVSDHPLGWASSDYSSFTSHYGPAGTDFISASFWDIPSGYPMPTVPGPGPAVAASTVTVNAVVGGPFGACTTPFSWPSATAAQSGWVGPFGEGAPPFPAAASNDPWTSWWGGTACPPSTWPGWTTGSWSASSSWPWTSWTACSATVTATSIYTSEVSGTPSLVTSYGYKVAEGSATTTSSSSTAEQTGAATSGKQVRAALAVGVAILVVLAL